MADIFDNSVEVMKTLTIKKSTLSKQSQDAANVGEAGVQRSLSKNLKSYQQNMNTSMPRDADYRKSCKFCTKAQNESFDVSLP